MGVRYADRAFITVNGAAIIDVQSASLRQNHNARAVPSFTRDRFNKGHVRGNVDIDITLTIALQNTLSRPKLDFIDYEANDVQLTFVVGVEQFICTGLFLKDNDDNAGGVGDEVKTTFNYSALKILDAVGDSALFDLDLIAA